MCKPLLLLTENCIRYLSPKPRTHVLLELLKSIQLSPKPQVKAVWISSRIMASHLFNPICINQPVCVSVCVHLTNLFKKNPTNCHWFLSFVHAEALKILLTLLLNNIHTDYIFIPPREASESWNFYRLPLRKKLQETCVFYLFAVNI